MSSRCFLAVDGVRLRFGERMILQDVALQLPIGQVMGLLGRNGCGKSSLLQIIFGSLKAEQASVRLDGRWQATLYRVKDAVMYLPQSPLLPASVTFETALDLYVHNPNRKASLQHRTEIAPLLKKRSGQVSGGERRFAEILLVLYSNASFLLLDEPFAGLSPLETEKLQTEVNRVRSEKGILLTDQRYESLLSISDQVLLLREGTAIRIENREQLHQFHYLTEEN